ncbi:MAG: hypothetical protein ACJAU1_001663 [Psychromonas sp.]|jgi:hypothetical protein
MRIKTEDNSVISIIKELVIIHFTKQFRLFSDTDWYDWQTSSQIRCYLNKYYITGFAEMTFYVASKTQRRVKI